MPGEATPPGPQAAQPVPSLRPGRTVEVQDTATAPEPVPMQPEMLPLPEPALMPEPDVPAYWTGLTPAEALLVLGEPREVKRDGAAQIWLWQQAPCDLRLVFEEPAVDQPLELSLARATDNQGASVTVDSCLKTLQP